MTSPINSTCNGPESRLAPAWFLLCLPVLLLTTPSLPQDLPDKIRGYKVHSDKIVVSTAKTSDSTADASVTVGEPKIVEAALAGVTFELPAEIRTAKQSGKVDFLAFQDVRVNGIAVEVEEYRDAFDFRKGETTALPRPARILLPVTGMLQAAWNEMRDSREQWTVSGRVFVFGRFRKFGMYHKRVVRVDFEIRIQNPLKST